MRMVTPSLFLRRFAFTLLGTLCFSAGFSSLLEAEETLESLSAPKTRTVVADVLDVEGDFHIVRGDLGEIRIEVTPDTKLSETFTYGDRIKAVLLPNDVALTITRAAPDEPVGIISNEPTESALPAVKLNSNKSKLSKTEKTSADEDEKTPPRIEIPKVRIVIANILMVDGSFYIVRTEWGEIQIEITPNTKLSEDFKFGDKIKARITPANTALSIARAGEDDPVGIHKEATSDAPLLTPSASSSADIAKSPPSEKKQEPSAPEPPTTRTIVADVLMVDGDLYIVRGERGEIRIEVTPETTISETFDYGDRIKAEVLPNDKALTIKRAGPDDHLGITTH